MSTEDYKTIARLQHDEVWSKGNLAIIEEIYAPNFICHFVGGSKWRGREGVRQQVTRHRTSFPDWNEQIEDMIAEGDRVVTRFTSQGTHKGEFQGIPPTDTQVTIAEAEIWRTEHSIFPWGQVY